MKTAMVSGHLDLTATEFWTHYAEALKASIALGHAIVVGDAPGADAMAQAYLFVQDYNNVTVYSSEGFPRPRHNIGNWPNITIGHKPYEKDAAMTAASDYDIAWVRPGKESSGTATNINRRARMKKE
jgi:hypothetical protein